MRNGGGRTVIALAAGALISGCAGAPPPDPPKPATTSVAVVAPPSPTPTQTAEVEPPPLPVGEGFVADPDEPLPKGAVVRCGSGKMHVTSSQAMAVTEEGQIWAVDGGSSDWTLRDVNHGVDVASLPIGSEAVFTPDGSTLVAWQKNQAHKLVLYSVPQKKVISTIDLPWKKPVKSKGALADAAEFGMIGLLSITGRSPATLYMAPDGKAVAVTADDQVHLIDLTTGKLIKSQKSPADSRFTSLSNNGDRGLFEIKEASKSKYSWSENRPLRGYLVVDMRTGATVKRETFKKVASAPGEGTLFEHEDASFRIDASGQTLLRSDHGELTILDLKTGAEKVTLLLENKVTQRSIGGSLFGGGGLGLSNVRSPPSRAWSAQDFRVLGDRTLLVYGEIVDQITHAVTSDMDDLQAMSPSGKHHLTEKGGRVHRFPKDIEVKGLLEGPVTALAFASDNQLVIADGPASLHHPGTCAAGDLLQKGAEHATAGRRGTVALAGGTELTLRLGDKPLRTAKAHSRILDLAASPEGDHVYAALDKGTLVSFDSASEYKESLKRKFDVALQSVAVSRDGLLLAVSGGRSFDRDGPRLWLLDLPSLDPVAESAVRLSGSAQIAGSALVLVAGVTDGISAYSVQGLTERYRIRASGCCDKIAVSPDGSHFAGTAQRGFLVWETETRRLVARVPNAHRERVRSIAFSQDGKYIATGSEDATVLVWQTDKLPLRGYVEKTETIATNADEARRFFSARSDSYEIAADGKLALRPGRKGPLPALQSVTHVVSWYSSHCAIAESVVRCWGSTADGLLGVPEKRSRLGHAEERAAPTTIKVPDPIDLRMWDGYACALSKSGSLVCWGRESAKSSDRPPSERFAGIKSFDLGRGIRCAAETGGDVRCWEPAESVETRLSGAQATRVEAGFDHACVLDVSGHIKCVGENFRDALGDGTGLDRKALVEVKGLSGVTIFATGTFGSCAIAARGEAYCWGTLGEAHLDGVTRVKSLDGATALQARYGDMCGRIGDRVDCVKLVDE